MEALNNKNNKICSSKLYKLRVKKRDTTKRAKMQCSNVNLGAVQKAEPHHRARGVKHVN